MKLVLSILRNWIPLAVAIVFMSGLCYLTTQQALRQSANDPQIQLAEDGARSLESGKAPNQVVTNDAVDIATSLAPFVTVFDDSGHVVASSGVLHGQPLTLPSGVINYVRENGEDRITWQPEPNVRVASVVTRFNGPSSGYVLAGRLLREVEIRESNAELVAALGGITTLFATLIAVTVVEIAHRSIG